MNQLGLINIIRTSGETTGARGSGALGALVTVIGVVLLAAGGYRVLDAGLGGVAATTAEANRVVGWALAAVLLVAALTAAGWVLLARRHAVREAPIVEAFAAATDRALEAHHQRQLDPPPPDAGRRELHPVHHITAERLDRLDPLDLGCQEGGPT